MNASCIVWFLDLGFFVSRNMLVCQLKKYQHKYQYSSGMQCALQGSGWKLEAIRKLRNIMTFMINTLFIFNVIISGPI